MNWFKKTSQFEQRYRAVATIDIWKESPEEAYDSLKSIFESAIERGDKIQYQFSPSDITSHNEMGI